MRQETWPTPTPFRLATKATQEDTGANRDAFSLGKPQQLGMEFGTSWVGLRVDLIKSMGNKKHVNMSFDAP